jgi:hypothetical protein
MAAAREAVKLDPKSLIAYSTLAHFQRCSNLFEDSKATCWEALAHGLNSALFHSILFEVLRTAGPGRRGAGADGVGEGRVGKKRYSGLRGIGRRDRRPHPVRARKFRAAIQVARKERLPNFVDSVLLDEALVDVFAGFLPEARREAEKVPPEDEPDMIVQSGFAAALSGGTSYAEKAIARLRGNPKISVMRARVDLPLVEASVAIYQKKAADAIKLLEPTQVYELLRYFIPFLRGRSPKIPVSNRSLPCIRWRIWTWRAPTACMAGTQTAERPTNASSGSGRTLIRTCQWFWKPAASTPSCLPTD